jgi:hypothetical protein
MESTNYNFIVHFSPEFCYFFLVGQNILLSTVFLTLFSIYTFSSLYICIYYLKLGIFPLWSKFLATDPEIPGPVPGTTRFFWKVVGLKRSPSILVSITEELLEWKSSGSWSRKPRLTAVWIRCADHTTPSQKLALSSPTSGIRLVGIVRLRTKAAEFSFSLVWKWVISYMCECKSCSQKWREKIKLYVRKSFKLSSF